MPMRNENFDQRLASGQSDGKLSLPVMRLDKQITMLHPVSSISIHFAKKILNASGNQTHLTSLHESTSNIGQAHGSRLHLRGKVIVPLTFAYDEDLSVRNFSNAWKRHYLLEHSSKENRSNHEL